MSSSVGTSRRRALAALVRAKSKSILDMGGLLKAPKGKRVRTDDMNPLALMPALDTNDLVRYVIQDDTGQTAAAGKLIRRAVADGTALFVPVTVALELEWVLRSSYGFGKAEGLQTLWTMDKRAARLQGAALLDVLFSWSESRFL